MYQGMWQYPRNFDLCCIYRVPESMREVNPKAYTPQLVLIGPLHLSLKFEALETLERGDRITSTSRGYLDMEEHKKTYLAAFIERFDGVEIIDGFRSMIEEHEENIRESYSESTDWIKSSEFVELVLHDSVFIIEFMLRGVELGHEKKIGDPLIDTPCLVAAVESDLILLENQLPYFILEKLFDAVFPKIHPDSTFRTLIIWYFFQFKGKIREDFKHITDLHRCVLVETYPKYGLKRFKPMVHIHNAHKLDGGGVKFEAVEEVFSLNVRFENGCLKMPRLTVDDQLEMRLRNIIALEQCHYPHDTLVCSYVFFLDHLIDSEKDIDLLVQKGIIKNSTGEPASVSRVVNKLRLGITESGSYYTDVAVEVNNYSKNWVNRLKAILKCVYFGNPWAGIGTIAAMCLLVMAIIQT